MSPVDRFLARTAAAIRRAAHIPEEEDFKLADGYVPEEEVRAAAHLETTLRRLSATEFARLCRHGWEVADCTLHTYHPRLFGVGLEGSHETASGGAGGARPTDALLSQEP